MIVVDTNVVAYAVLPSERTSQALVLLEREPQWLAPALWRQELTNVLATVMRVHRLSLEEALVAFAAAEALITEAPVERSTEEVLRLAARGGVSAWDAEFILAAEKLGMLLVTADKRLCKAFPERAVLLERAVR